MTYRLLHDRRGATSIEYAMVAALIGLPLMFALPDIAASLRSTMLRTQEGLKGKTCDSDPTARGTQCHV